MGLFGKKKVMGYDTYDDKKKMSKAEYLKKSLKAVGEGAKKVAKVIVPPKSPEQIAFEKELKKKTQEAQRKAFLKAAVKESKVKGAAMAKNKYNPSKYVQKQSKDAMDVLMRL